MSINLFFVFIFGRFNLIHIIPATCRCWMLKSQYFKGNLTILHMWFENTFKLFITNDKWAMIFRIYQLKSFGSGNFFVTISFACSKLALGLSKLIKTLIFLCEAYSLPCILNITLNQKQRMQFF